MPPLRGGVVGGAGRRTILPGRVATAATDMAADRRSRVPVTMMPTLLTVKREISLRVT